MDFVLEFLFGKISFFINMSFSLSMAKIREGVEIFGEKDGNNS